MSRRCSFKLFIVKDRRRRLRPYYPQRPAQINLLAHSTLRFWYPLQLRLIRWIGVWSTDLSAVHHANNHCCYWHERRNWLITIKMRTTEMALAHEGVLRYGFIADIGKSIMAFDKSSLGWWRRGSRYYSWSRSSHPDITSVLLTAIQATEHEEDRRLALKQVNTGVGLSRDTQSRFKIYACKKGRGSLLRATGTWIKQQLNCLKHSKLTEETYKNFSVFLFNFRTLQKVRLSLHVYGFLSYIKKSPIRLNAGDQRTQLVEVCLATSEGGW